MSELSPVEQIKRKARNLGFNACAITNADAPSQEVGQAFETWLEQGMNGTMGWFERSKQARLDIRSRFPWAKSVIVLRADYPSDRDPSVPKDSILHRVARYAQGQDYHDYLKPALEKFETYVSRFDDGERERGCEAKWYQDTGPILEHVYAERAGIGWTGKHTLTLNEKGGSYFFLAEIITSLDLPIDAPAQSHCGTCRACIDACPTDAIVAPYQLDARRCISYLTIEHKGQIEDELRSELAGYVFGCDICQEVCPYNAEARVPTRVLDASLQVNELDALTLLDLLMMPDARLETRLEGSPMHRSGAARLKRNAALVAGQERSEDAFKGIVHCITHFEPMVRAACAWALGCYGESSLASKARQALSTHQKRETDQEIRDQVIASLQRLHGAA
ncbi:MAG: tRNA epoxyqueuosine(34) reductase QueG [Planctomycetes bacterium]|nr:tRNA epoxyqueuosine(34) reductase QueG [Planctomycetota bacterium]